MQLNDQGYKKFRQARFVSVLALSFPAFLFLVITASLWSALYRLSSKLDLLINIDYTPQYLKGLLSFMNLEKDAGFCVVNPKFEYSSDCFLSVLSNFSATPFGAVFIILIFLVVVLALCALLPSLISEVFPPKFDSVEQPADNNSVDNAADNMGIWLTQGYGITICAINFLICIIAPLLLFIAMVLSLNYYFGIKEFIINDFHIPIGGNFLERKTILDALSLSRSFLIWSGTVIVASTGSLIAFGNRLKRIAVAIRSVLDAVLDVDNYLRLYPKENNPRAVIFARYTSLLRYICDRPERDRYDAIVIIAHSQGTVITADLLRYLKVEQPEFKEEIPNIYLFTMGSPIKQLYSFAFPHLYHWVHNSSNTKTNPNPNDLFKVQQWVNAYRSGDYVGRYLWHEPDSQEFNNPWSPVDLDKESNIHALGEKIKHDSEQTLGREFCIGAGGHTHYWNETAPEIAQELNRLIRDAKKNMTHIKGKIKLIQPEIGVDISPDNRAATVTFSHALVELNKNEFVKSKTISMLLPIERSGNDARLKVDIRGHKNLDYSTKGILIAQIAGATNTFTFVGSDEDSSNKSSNFLKPIDLDLDLHWLELEEKLFYPVTIFLMLEKFVANKDQALLVVDSLDFEFVKSSTEET